MILILFLTSCTLSLEYLSLVFVMRVLILILLPWNPKESIHCLLYLVFKHFWRVNQPVHCYVFLEYFFIILLSYILIFIFSWFSFDLVLFSAVVLPIPVKIIELILVLTFRHLFSLALWLVHLDLWAEILVQSVLLWDDQGFVWGCLFFC